MGTLNGSFFQIKKTKKYDEIVKEMFENEIDKEILDI